MNRKQKINLLRICIATVLTACVFAVQKALNIETRWICILAYAIPYVVIGYDVVKGAVLTLIRGRVFDEKFLMFLATAGAFVIAEYPEAVMVMLFYQVGELFQSIAVGKSRKSIASLMNIRPDSAVVLREGEEVTLSPEEVQKGETVLVKPGEKIPLDGIIISGSTTVNNSALTGESVPVNKGEGDTVFSGSVNINGIIKIKTLGVYAESTVSKILNLVENSQSKKSKSENFISKFAKYYTPFVVICAILLALIPSIITRSPWEWIKRALVFLVVSCPCALVISVPLSFFGGIGGASKKGILIKGANYMETLSKINAVIFDKTGTLTEGCFKVVGINSEGMKDAELLEIAAYAESYSCHPIADSIKEAYNGILDKSRINNVNEILGKGVEATIDDEKVYVGNKTLMDEISIEIREPEMAGTIVYVVKGNKYLGNIVISDIIKKESQTAIMKLKESGIKKTYILSGDREKTVSAVVEKIGVDEYKAELLPEEKVEEAERIKSEGYVTAFVGDGINDAPVLTVSDIGIAMGAIGSDAAIEAADVVIMDDNPLKIDDAIRISGKTMRIVYENIIFALLIKLAVLVLGAVGVAGMWSAVFADVGVSMIAILNAMRALKTIKSKNGTETMNQMQ